MNLVVNARDAMPTSGKLTFCTSLVEITEEVRLAPAPKLSSRRKFVSFSVSDTGHGMDTSTLGPHLRTVLYDQRTRQRHGHGLGHRLRRPAASTTAGWTWKAHPAGAPPFRAYFPAQR